MSRPLVHIAIWSLNMLWAGQAIGQIYFYPVGPAPRSVSTSAEATVVVPAHRVSFQVSISQTAPTAAEAGTKHAGAMERLAGALRELGFGENAPPSSTYSISREENWDTGELTGYTASSELTLELDNPLELGVAVDKLLAAGASEVSNIKFHAEDSTGARNAAIDEAFRLAHDEARMLGKLSNAALGSVLNVSTDSKARSVTTAMAASVTVSATRTNQTTIPVPEVKITASVSARWELIAKDTPDGK